MKNVKRFAFWFSLFFSPLMVYADPPIEVIYWKASDIEKPSQEELDVFNDLMLEVQSFFASEMDRHGFGEKTFDFNEIQVIEGKRNLAYYSFSQLRFVSESSFIEKGSDNQIWVVFLGESEYISGHLGLSQKLCLYRLEDCNNLVVVPTIRRHIIESIAAHEVGHAFGLQHVDNLWLEDRLDIMHHTQAVIPGKIMTLDKYFALSKTDATILNDADKLYIQDDSDVEIVIDTDVNDDGYTDLSDCLIVRSAMSQESMYDTDINNDGVTNILDLMLVKAAAFEAIAAAAPPKRKVITTIWGELKKK